MLMFRIMHTENTNKGLLTYSIYFTSVVPTQYAADSEIDFSNENNVSKLTVAYCSFTVLEQYKSVEKNIFIVDHGKILAV